MLGKYLSVSQRATVVALIDEGVSTSDVARRVGCCVQTVRNIKRASVTDPSGSVPMPKKIPGRPKVTSK